MERPYVIVTKDPALSYTCRLSKGKILLIKFQKKKKKKKKRCRNGKSNLLKRFKIRLSANPSMIRKLPKNFGTSHDKKECKQDYGKDTRKNRSCVTNPVRGEDKSGRNNKE